MKGSKVSLDRFATLLGKTSDRGLRRVLKNLYENNADQVYLDLTKLELKSRYYRDNKI